MLLHTVLRYVLAIQKSCLEHQGVIDLLAHQEVEQNNIGDGLTSADGMRMHQQRINGVVKQFGHTANIER